MRIFPFFRQILRSQCRRSKVKGEIDEELRYHIERRTADNLAAGLAPEEAAREARKQFGNWQSLREECREEKGASFGETSWQDIRFGWRMLCKSRGFTAIAVPVLALCIGANLAIFAVVDGILVRPLPFPQAEQLVTMFNRYPKMDGGPGGSSLANLYYRHGQIAALSSVAAYKNDAAIVGETGGARRVDILRVSPEFFETLGAGPVLGRAFMEEEMTFQTHHVAILSHDYWQRQLNGHRGVLGSKIRVNGFDKQVIGVLPPGFRFLSAKAQIYLPLSSNPDQRGMDALHNSGDCEMIGRLAPGATVATAQAQLDAHNAAVGKDFPYAKQVEATGFYTRVASLHANHVEAIKPTLLLLQAGGLFLLLIGVVNLVNLLIVRASSRAQELAIRQSLGASWLRMARQMITETILLTLMGGLGGLALGALGIKLLGFFGVDRLPLGLQVTFDGRTALAAFLGALLVGIVIGLPLAWSSLHGNLAHGLRSETRGGTSNQAIQRLRHSFVVTQIALAFVLLTGAGLLAVSLKRTMEISPGFNPGQTLAGSISMLHRNYLENPARLQFAERLYEELRRLPGVQSAGIANNMPVGGKESGLQRRVMTTGNRAGESSPLPIAPHIYGVVGDYFRALGIPLRAGRFFDEFQSGRMDRVCVVDEAFAQRNWPETSAVGQLVYDGPEIEPGEEPFRVIGVAGTVKQTELTEPPTDGTLYFPLRDNPLNADNLCVAIRTRQQPEALGPALQQLARRIEPELPLTDLRTMETRITDSLILRRAPLLLAGAFAAVALLLAALGTYGVLSYAVTQRRREIGVRMALGALPGQIRRQFLSLGLRLCLAGILLGAFGVWLAGRIIQNILFQVPSFHLPTLAGTALLMGGVALFACVLPAWRASRVESLEVLRNE